MSKAIKIGDKVRFVDRKAHKQTPEYYPSVGTIGTVVMDECNPKDWKIQWPKGTTSGDDRWYCGEKSIELFDGKIEKDEMTNEEIWEMLKPKMEKNGLTYLHYGYDGDGKNFFYYKDSDVINAIAVAYRSGYERCMKGRPFKFGEKKKKSGHWKPVDPNNLPKEGTKVKLKKEYCNYYGGVVESGEIGIVFHDASYVTMVLGYGISFGKYKTVFLPLDRNFIANCLDMWVEDDE